MKKKLREKACPSCSEESDDEEIANFVRKLKRGTRKYKGKLPLICFNCGKIGHFSSKCPYKHAESDDDEDETPKKETRYEKKNQKKNNRKFFKKKNFYSKEDSSSSYNDMLVMEPDYLPIPEIFVSAMFVP